MDQQVNKIAGITSNKGAQSSHARWRSVTWGKRPQMAARQWKVSQ